MQWAKEMAKNHDVLILDRENSLHTLQRRIRRLGGPLPDNVMYWGGWIKDEGGKPMEPPSPDSQDVLAFVKEARNPVIILDTFSTFSDCKENDNDDVKEWFKPLRTLVSQANGECTIGVLHHLTKNGNSPYRGASAFKAAVDVGLMVVSTFHDDNKIDAMSVTAFKTREDGMKPTQYKMINGCPIRVASNTAEQTQGVMDFLARNPDLTKDKFEKLAKKELKEVSYAGIRKCLAEGINNGSITYLKCKLRAKEGWRKSSQAILDIDGNDE